MTSITRRIILSLKEAYKNLNPSTLTGAIDVIVVKQEDGTLRCTPFHVRFGKLSVLQNQQNKVYITINGNPVEDLYMELGEAGEALFVEEDITYSCDSPLQDSEIANINAVTDADSALSISSDQDDHLPQILHKNLDEQNTVENNQQIPDHVYEQTEKINANGTVPNRRREKRETLNQTSSEEEDSSEKNAAKTIENMHQNARRRSRARQRESDKVLSDDYAESHSSDEQNDCGSTPTRRRSASESDLQIFPIDDDKESEASTPFVDAHSRINSIDSRKKIVLIPPKVNIVSDDETYNSSPDESINMDELPFKSKRAPSNPIPIEQKQVGNKSLTVGDESNDLIDDIFSQSAPIKINSTAPIRISQSNDSNTYYLNENYTPTSSSFENTESHRPTSPKSDTEYELDKSAEQSTVNRRTILGWRWKWGELPEQRRSVFKYFWPSSSTKKQNIPKEGVYLDDITNNKCDNRSLYLPQMDYEQYQRRTSNDDDQESGTGTSLPHSPTREYEATFLSGDAQISLCGNPDKLSEITDTVFNASIVPYERLANNPSILNDPNLVVRVNGKYYNWEIGSTIIASNNIYQKSLPTKTIEQLQEKYASGTKSRTTSSSWWPFSARKSNENITDDSCKSAAETEALALAVKSEEISTILKNPIMIRNNSHDHNQVDHEVKKITDKIEQHTNVSTLKRTMILTSDQLKRLNLKPGLNQVEFSVTTAYQGTTVAEANIFLFDCNTKFVISDIDGTITRSDVFGHILPLVGRDWSHDGIAEFFQAIQENGYQFIYLSARAIGQSYLTRSFLKSIKQCDSLLPDGPLLISPDSLVDALYREVIAKKPEDFKIECLKNIASLFPGKNPFYAGFGNRINDQWAYTAVGIPVTRIFTINPRGEVVREKLSPILSTSYKNLHEVVDQVFPPMDSFSASESYSSFTFWRHEPVHDSLEDEMRQHLEDMTKVLKAKQNKYQHKHAKPSEGEKAQSTQTNNRTVKKA